MTGWKRAGLIHHYAIMNIHQEKDIATKYAQDAGATIKACDGTEELMNSERIAVGTSDLESQSKILKVDLFSYDTPGFMKEKKHAELFFGARGHGHDGHGRNHDYDFE
ncbi:hypothetical protein V5799_009805 [Amblyomma americanum]|uniref:Uncharacterized protein n=1 Tax=Amblyomma americanum TaxID=6943 RepID=A0AAQ4F9F6_AMBAM